MVIPIPLVTKETINKLKLRRIGVVSYIYDKNNVFFREFSTIKDAAYFAKKIFLLFFLGFFYENIKYK